jgi:hypothetical protein
MRGLRRFCGRKGLTAESAKTAENKDVIRNSAYSAVSAVNSNGSVPLMFSRRRHGVGPPSELRG